MASELAGELSDMEKHCGVRLCKGHQRLVPLTREISNETIEDQELHERREYHGGAWVEIRIGHQGSDWDALVLVTSSVCDTESVQIPQGQATEPATKLVRSICLRTFEA